MQSFCDPLDTAGCTTETLGEVLLQPVDPHRRVGPVVLETLDLLLGFLQLLFGVTQPVGLLPAVFSMMSRVFLMVSRSRSAFIENSVWSCK